VCVKMADICVFQNGGYLCASKWRIFVCVCVKMADICCLVRRSVRSNEREIWWMCEEE
jgi:hypothetical protein